MDKIKKLEIRIEDMERRLQSSIGNSYGNSYGNYWGQYCTCLYPFLCSSCEKACYSGDISRAIKTHEDLIIAHQREIERIKNSLSQAEDSS